MHRTLAPLPTLVATASLLAVWLVAVPLVSAGNPCFHGFDIPPATTSTSTTVDLEPCAFAPTIAKVPLGSLVTFRNGTDFSHLVTGADQAWGDREVEIPSGGSIAYRFDTAGIFPYACVLHPGMSGVIVVGDVSSAGTGTTTGAGTAVGATAAAVPPPASDGWASAAVAIVAAIAGAVLGAAAVVIAVRPRRRQDAPVPEAG